MRSIKILLVMVCFFLNQKIILSMHSDDELKENIYYMDECFDDGYIKEHSVVVHWQHHEFDALNALVTAIVNYSSIECFVHHKRMGTFKGREQCVLTYFDDGHIQETKFNTFKELLLGADDSDYSDMIFRIDKSWYTLDGNLTIAAYDTSQVDKSRSHTSVGLWSSLVQSFQRKVLARN